MRTAAMNDSLTSGFALFLVFLSLAFAHRLDEYLQAALLSVDRDHVQVNLRLNRGVAVFGQVLGAIDTNGDEFIFSSEQRVYIKSIMDELSLKAYRWALVLRALSPNFPSLDEMKLVKGKIHFQLIPDLPPGGGRRHELGFENHHQSGISVYLVNSLVPIDENTEMAAQGPNETQSVHPLQYGDKSAESQPAQENASLLSGLRGAFHLGLRHIAGRTDHLLFLLALLLPALLLACSRRWEQPAGVGRSVRHILAIVTSFPLGNSLSLALAASGLVQVPERPIEVLIAVFILVSALHAIRSLFRGREALIPASFKLIHESLLRSLQLHLYLGGVICWSA